MTIANCPRCEEQIRVPAGVSADATVQCPLCQEEYSLTEPLRKLPPELLVIDNVDAAPVDDVGIGASWDVSVEPPDEVEPANAFALAPVAGDANPAFDFDSGDASGPSPISSVRTSARRAKPKGSPIKSVLSIIIGGMLAFPIAQLILWHLPGDLKRDFGAGPVVAKYIPLIVPERFRGQSAGGGQSSEIPDFNPEGLGEFSFTGDGQASQSNGKNRRKQKQKNATPSFAQATDDTSGNADFELPETDGAFTDSGEGGAGGTESTGVELPSIELPSIEPPGVSVPGIELPALELPGASEPDAAGLGDPAPADDDNGTEPAPRIPTPEVPSPKSTEEVRRVGSVKTAPVYEPAELVAAVAKADQASGDWDATDESALSGRQKGAFYRAMASLGEVLALSDPEDDESANERAATDRLLAAVGKHAAKIQTIVGVESQWIEAPRQSRGSDGICVHGTVAAVEQRGELFETIVESNGWRVPVMTPDDPSDSMIVGEQVLVLGAIVHAPSDNLVGYEGNAEVVIVGGLHAALEQKTQEQE